MIDLMTDFQLINGPGNKKKKARLKKELDNFKSELESKVVRSHRLVDSLRQLTDKKSQKKKVN